MRLVIEVRERTDEYSGQQLSRLVTKELSEGELVELMENAFPTSPLSSRYADAHVPGVSYNLMDHLVPDWMRGLHGAQTTIRPVGHASAVACYKAWCVNAAKGEKG
jgi:hypothetical protein